MTSTPPPLPRDGRESVERSERRVEDLPLPVSSAEHQFATPAGRLRASPLPRSLTFLEGSFSGTTIAKCEAVATAYSAKLDTEFRGEERAERQAQGRSGSVATEVVTDAFPEVLLARCLAVARWLTRRDPHIEKVPELRPVRTVDGHAGSAPKYQA